MHLPKFNLLLFAAFAISALAVSDDDYGSLDTPIGTIVFCSEKNYQGDCSDHIYIKYNICYTIPDSNAKGDAHSSFYTTSRTARCRLYTDDNCQGHHSGWDMKTSDIRYDDKPYRTFGCRDISILTGWT